MRSDAHGFRSRPPRSLLKLLNFCRIRAKSHVFLKPSVFINFLAIIKSSYSCWRRATATSERCAKKVAHARCRHRLRENGERNNEYQSFQQASMIASCEFSGRESGGTNLGPCEALPRLLDSSREAEAVCGNPFEYKRFALLHFPRALRDRR